MIRIGHGYDVHAFGGNKTLVLGGVKILGHLGLLAHSDGDVILHSVCDAILGAAGMGDIGAHFPDTDAKFEDVDSRELLRQTFALINEKGFVINNLDITIVAQTPRMSPHINDINLNISKDLEIQVEQVNVKATTTEELGYIGRKEGIAVHSVCLLVLEK